MLGAWDGIHRSSELRLGLYLLEVVGPEPTPGNDGGENSQNRVESDVWVLPTANVKTIVPSMSKTSPAAANGVSHVRTCTSGGITRPSPASPSATPAKGVPGITAYQFWSPSSIRWRPASPAGSRPGISMSCWTLPKIADSSLWAIEWVANWRPQRPGSTRST